MKIGIAMRKVFEERRKRKKLQEICLLEWEEIIAEAARIGASGEDELQWDAYGILKEKMHQDWLQVIEMEKAMASRSVKTRGPLNQLSRRRRYQRQSKPNGQIL
uniref:Uncharacterized protein n=1 Tax=Picea sitchensis TaxID=3332 RepID=B8LP56_PICSI|nr:unknown [Picea sitchensis]